MNIYIYIYDIYIYIYTHVTCTDALWKLVPCRLPLAALPQAEAGVASLPVAALYPSESMCIYIYIYIYIYVHT